MILLQKQGINTVFHPIVFESLVNRGRNAATALFMSDSSLTHMLFIDSDIEFDAEDILRMLKVDKECVGAAYAKKFLNTNKLAYALASGSQNPLELSTDVSVHIDEHAIHTDKQLVEAEYVTTGCLLIKRAVIEKMMRDYPERKYINDIDGYSTANKDMFYDLFTVTIHPVTRRLESEDYGFSRLWRNIGGKIHILTDVSIEHYGWFAYPANLYRQMQFVERLERDELNKAK